MLFRMETRECNDLTCRKLSNKVEDQTNGVCWMVYCSQMDLKMMIINNRHEDLVFPDINKQRRHHLGKSVCLGSVSNEDLQASNLSLRL